MLTNICYRVTGTEAATAQLNKRIQPIEEDIANLRTTVSEVDKAIEHYLRYEGRGKQ